MSRSDPESAEQRRARKEEERARKRQRRQRERAEGEEAPAAAEASAAAEAQAKAAASTHAEAAPARPSKRARRQAAEAAVAAEAASQPDADAPSGPEHPSDSDPDSDSRSARREAKAAKRARKAERRARKAAKQARREARAARRAAREEEAKEDGSDTSSDDEGEAANVSAADGEYVDSSSEEDEEEGAALAAAAPDASGDAPAVAGAAPPRDVFTLPPRPKPLRDDASVESVFFRRKGLLTPRERWVLKQGIAEYKEAHGLDDESWVRLCTAARGGTASEASRECWRDLSQLLPLRPRSAVRDYCQRLYQNRNLGRWSQEEVERLRELVDALGEHRWTAVGDEIGRLADDCRDKWRLIRDPTRRFGPWALEEDADLTFWVLKQSALERAAKLRDAARAAGDAALASEREEEFTALMSLQPTDLALLPEDTPLPTQDILWTPISSAMSRPHSACRNRWYTVLLHRLAQGNERLELQGLRWNREEEGELIQKLWAQGVDQIDEFDWHKAVSPSWPSAHTVRDHFLQLYRRLVSVPRYAPLSRPDADLDTILRKMAKHLSPRGDPDIFRTRTTRNKQARLRSAKKILNTLGRGPAAAESGEGEAAQEDPAEAAVSREESERLERQRIRAEAASLALAQATTAEREKAEAAQRKAEEARAREVRRAEAEQKRQELAKRVAEATLLAADKKAKALTLYAKPGARAGAAAAARKPASRAAASASGSSSSSETSDDEGKEEKEPTGRVRSPAAPPAAAAAVPAPAAVARRAPAPPSSFSSSSETSDDEERKEPARTAPTHRATVPLAAAAAAPRAAAASGAARSAPLAAQARKPQVKGKQRPAVRTGLPQF